MATSFATTIDFEIRWPHSLSTEQEGRVSILLEDASRRIISEYPDMESRVAEDDGVALDAKIVVIGMVKRAMLAETYGADGADQVTQTAGPFSEARRFTNPMGDLYLTAADRLILGGPLVATAQSVWVQ